MSKKILVFSTAPDAETAARIAHAVVEERLAACVSVLPGVTSVYRWKEAVEQASELLLLIKTTEDRLEPLRTRVLALHPYELPEFVATEIAHGHTAYLDWIGDSTREL